jgi:hypothetical protein
MDRLSIILTLMVGAVVAGAGVVVAFSMGVQETWVIVLAAALTLLVTWPLSYVISRRIKHRDPSLDHMPEPEVLPRPGASEI